MKRQLSTGPFTAAASLALLALAACGGGETTPAAEDQARMEEVAQAATQELVQTAPRPEPIDVTTLGHNLGSEETAPIMVIEFSDFGCGYCRAFHVDAFPNLQNDYVKPGTVAWKYVPFELGIFSNGREGAVAGQCAADQGKFFEMGDLLFQRQSEWKNESDPNPVFLGFARDLGLDVASYETCLGSDEAAAEIRKNTRIAQQIGIRGTPTFFVNGFPLQGALPESVFRDVFDGVLEEMEGTGQPGA